MHPDLMDPKTARELLSVSKATMDRYLQQGKIPAAQVGTRWRVSRRGVLEALGAEVEQTDSSPEPEILQTAEVADLLGVSPMTVRRLIESGEIPASKPAGIYLIHWAEYFARITNSSVPPPRSSTE